MSSSSSHRHVLALSASLSLLIHAGLLAAIGQLSVPIPDLDEPPLVTVTLVPTPSIHPEPAAPALPMKRATATRPSPRPTSMPLPQPAPVAPPTAPSLALDAQPPPRLIARVSKTRTLTDRRTADALLAQRLLKMAKPSNRPTPPEPPPVPARLPEPTPSIFPPVATMDRSHSASHEDEPASLPPPRPSRRVLRVQHPGPTAGKSRGKVGILRSIPPSYPRIAKEKGWEGTVILRVTVGQQGRADDIQVRKSSGYPVLDEAAVKAVKAWQFRPAYDGTIPLRTRVDIPVHFDLRQRIG